MKDIQNFHAAFYAIPDKSKQDAFLLKFCRASSPNIKRRKPAEEAEKGKSVVLEYSVRNEAGNHMKVCRKTFLNVLRITKHRVLGVFKRFKQGNAEVPVETRGGDRLSEKYHDKKLAVMKFICSLKGCESHYARAHSNRIYLPSELNITILWRMYNDATEDNLKVKEAYFRKIFVHNYNIGFSSPTVDECSTCLELKSRLNVEKDESQRGNLKAQLSVHKKRAAAFFSFLREKPDDCFLLSFDCQKNLPLPKVPDQIAYYSRQLYCYNLAVVKGLASDSINRNCVTIYTWAENEASKSSNEVASCVFHELQAADLSGYKRIRLVADGCPGQNKNVNILTMCAKWLMTYAPSHIEEITLVFPITGHSFLPADRVFGLLERTLKKKNTIVRKEEYHEIFQKFGTVKEIGKDWKPLDWKTVAKKTTKTASQLHFQISTCRRIVVERTKRGVQVRGEQTYNSDTGVSKTFLKKNGSLQNEIVAPIPIGIPVKAEKLADVKKLLSKHFGEQWTELEELKWYCEVIESAEPSIDVNNECECFQLGEEELEQEIFL